MFASHFRQGTSQAKLEPYFPFSKAVERYVRSYAAMGISYEGSVMNLDLLERKNKHDNGTSGDVREYIPFRIMFVEADQHINLEYIL